MQLVKDFLSSLVPYVSFLSFGLTLLILIRDYLSGRTNIDLTFPENYSTCLTTHSSNPVVKHLFSLAIIITNKSTNSIIINCIKLSDNNVEYSSEYDSKHISHFEANEISLSGEMVWYRQELRSTEFPVKLEPNSSRLLTFYFSAPVDFYPTKAALITDKKIFERNDIASFTLSLFEKNNRNNN